MADTAERSIEVDEKMAEVEEQITDAGEPVVINTEKEQGNDQAVPSANLDTAEITSAQECDSLPETTSIEENATELFVAGEGLDETSEQQSNKRKTDADDSSDESKRQKTEDPTPDAPSSEIPATESSGENKNKDELETKSEVNEIHSTPGNNTPDISSEDQVIKSCVEETVVEMERKEDDSSENKENVIDETISNVATEKTAELAEEEPAKVAAAKTLEDSELPVEAEPVSS